MDQDRLSSLAMCTIQRETVNKLVINNDTELLINKFAGKHGRNTHFFSDQMQMYILIFCLTLTSDSYTALSM